MRRCSIIGVMAAMVWGGAALGETIRVAAAISLKDVLVDAGAGFEKASGDKVEFSFGASGALEAQIKSGAEADVFISAAKREMDDLGGLVDADTRCVVARNALVLVVPADGKLNVGSFADLRNAEMKRVAAGEPKTVPAGEYAMEVFKKLKLVDALNGKLVYGANVRQVLSYVENGEVDAGVVYATDAKQAGDKVKVAATAGEDTHEPIVYPGAVVSASGHKTEAKKFLEFLGSEAGEKALEAGIYSPGECEVGDRPVSGDDISLLNATVLSATIAGCATACVAVAAVPLAFVAAKKRFPGKWLFEGLMLLPLVLPPTVVGYVLLTLFGRMGTVGKYLYAWFGYSMIFRFEGAVLAAAVVALPLMYMPARAAFAGVEREVEDAARTLGANGWQMFFRVSLPEAQRGVMAGLVLAFARALGEFGATLMVYGWQPGKETLPISVWAYFEEGELWKAWPAVGAMTGVSLVLILVYNRAVRVGRRS